jgi:hypothetical protein
MKAEILRRAEANSDEDEEGGDQRGRYPSTYRPKNVPFEEDEDDLDGLDESIGDVSVAGDGEGSEESDGEDEPEVCSIFRSPILPFSRSFVLFSLDHS